MIPFADVMPMHADKAPPEANFLSSGTFVVNK